MSLKLILKKILKKYYPQGERIDTITVDGSVIHFSVINSWTENRVKGFFSDEPQTIQWMSQFVKGSCFWDIGANVGSYTCYAASIKQCNVVAFEPLPFNIPVLAKNIILNKISDRVVICPLPLAESQSVGGLNMTYSCPGGSLATFGHDLGFDGKKMTTTDRVLTLGASADFILENFSLQNPRYIKIDVDGIEHFIVKGMHKILSQQSVEQVLIELNDRFEEQKSVVLDTMRLLGYVLLEIHEPPVVIEESPFSSVRNHLFIRSEV